MPVDSQILIGIVVATVVLFAAVIGFGLRFSNRVQTAAGELRAAYVLDAIGMSRTNLPALLYGVWQTTMADVILHVRDGDDAEVATIVHRVRGASITAGAEHYTVVVTSGRRESAVLVGEWNGGQASAPLCTFELRGWGGRRIARYTLPDNRAYSIRGHWSLSWRRKPLPIVQDEHVTGQLFGIGSAFNIGRAVILPATVPLPIRLFVLYKAIGSRMATSGGR